MGVYSIKDGTELAPGFEPQPPDDVQFGGGGGTIGGMEARLARIEQDLAVIKTQMDSFTKHYATKADVIQAKNSIILWVVSAIFLAQLLPSLISKFAP